MEKRYEFDEVSVLSALAVGEPGKRTFFLAVGRGAEWVRVWLEKGELQAVALAIRRLLSTLSRSRSVSRDETTQDSEAPSRLPAAEMEIQEISLGFDGEMATLDAIVRVLGPQRLDRAVLHYRTTLARLKQLGTQAEKVCAAGRPRCPLCGGPIDPGGHICPMNN